VSCRLDVGDVNLYLEELDADGIDRVLLSYVVRLTRDLAEGVVRLERCAGVNGRGDFTGVLTFNDRALRLAVRQHSKTSLLLMLSLLLLPPLSVCSHFFSCPNTAFMGLFRLLLLFRRNAPWIVRLRGCRRRVALQVVEARKRRRHLVLRQWKIELGIVATFRHCLHRLFLSPDVNEMCMLNVRVP